MSDNNARRRLFHLLLDFYKGKLSEDFFDDITYRKFYRKLYFETFRHLGFIQKIIQNYLKSETHIVPYAALVLGISQILYLDDIPDYAAVNESVNLVNHRQKGLINAVLRNVIRNKEEHLKSYNIEYDFPEWFLKRWKKRIKNKNEFNEFLFALNSSPDFYTVNLKTLKLSNYDDIAELTDNNRYNMDKASYLIPFLTGKKEFNKILDACAAPGGKTLILSKLYPNSSITAVEKNGIRIQTLIDNIKKYNAKNVIAVKENILNFRPDIKFDLILLDAPCTALGTVRKHPEVRWFKSPKDILKMSQQQERFLIHIKDFINPGGYIIYSVCSLEPEEGVKQIEKFLKYNNDFILTEPNCENLYKSDKFFYTLPHKTSTDGFFAAVLKKNLTP
jgi:16S rRNA (cytosine967-C5)-methyltransferase